MLTSPQLLYETRYPLGKSVQGKCYVCGGGLYSPIPTRDVIKPTFSDFQHMHTGGEAVCVACAWFMQNDKRGDLKDWLKRDKPQSPRTYSHILKHGTWHILSKGQKAQLLELLISGGLPEVCIISVSGQKHLFYKAKPNQPAQSQGWVLFEECLLWLDQAEFAHIVEHVQGLYLPEGGFSKDQILTGRYAVKNFDQLTLIESHEPHLTSHRGGVLLELAVYLVTKPKDIESEDEQ